MRHFWSDRSGNIAVLFAVAIVPIVGGIGAAVDYSMASAYRTDMQQALDSTALALSKILPADDKTVNEVGMQYFLASLGKHNMSNLKLTITPETGQVHLHATADYTPKIAKVLGISTFPVGANSIARWGLGKVEVALVLDNSGSMAQKGRMKHLKDAAKDLLGVLEDAAREPDDAKVAIVPFDSGVRVPYTYSSAPWWIKWDYWDDNEGSCKGGGWGDTSTKAKCESKGGKWKSANKKPWAGCVFDRDENPNVDNDVLDTAPIDASDTNAQRSKYPARNCDDNSLRAVMPLTYDWDELNQAVIQMQPSGWTNIGIGVVWGWHMLSPTPLYTEGAAYGTANLTKYIILMTDGDNTRSRFYSCSAWWGSCEIDTRTQLACTNAKDAGIEIYTIRLVEGNADLLRDCATKPSMYYDVQDASQLSAVFSGIGAEIANLHLSK